jgi:hypothetical protein
MEVLAKSFAEPIRYRNSKCKSCRWKPNTTCTASIILAFIVNPLPKIRLNTNGNEDALICDDNPKFSVELDAGIQDGTSITNYAYVWNKVGVSPSVGTNYTLVVFEEGIYSVKVTNSSGCRTDHKGNRFEYCNDSNHWHCWHDRY